ncbi:MAG: PQQ-binding-like beta-propeller repeat protein [Phycisphaerales bacterium]|nr:PQQ-binding-like beta-propeller repeat protein [Phycisphaerales bacterium]
MFTRNSNWMTAAMMGIVLFPPSAARADWNHFRGPNYDGISTEGGLKTTWTEAIPMVWDREIGSAFSSFACVGDRVFTCGTKDKKQVMLCLNATSGDVIWESPIEKEYRDEFGDGARATPTVDDGLVYIQGAHGTLLCVNAEDGKKVWHKSFDNKPQWGYSASVLVEGEWAIACAGKKDGALVAFDKKTGKKKWECGTDPVGYATPYPFTMNGRRYVVGFTGKSAIVADVQTGEIAWQTPWQTDWEVNAASPIYDNGHLLLSSGYQTGCGLYKLSGDGPRLSGEEVWRSKVMLNKFQSPVLHGGKLYGSDEKALICVDYLTGNEHWRVPRISNATVVLAGDDLFVLTEDGELQIGKAAPGGFIPTTKAQVLTGRCWTVPVLHQGRMYARNLERAVCFDLRESR